MHVAAAISNSKLDPHEGEGGDKIGTTSSHVHENQHQHNNVVSYSSQTYKMGASHACTLGGLDANATLKYQCQLFVGHTVHLDCHLRCSMSSDKTVNIGCDDTSTSLSYARSGVRKER
jgi:hypothetical protein